MALTGRVDRVLVGEVPVDRQPLDAGPLFHQDFVDGRADELKERYDLRLLGE